LHQHYPCLSGPLRSLDDLLGRRAIEVRELARLEGAHGERIDLALLLLLLVAPRCLGLGGLVGGLGRGRRGDRLVDLVDWLCGPLDRVGQLGLLRRLDRRRLAGLRRPRLPIFAGALGQPRNFRSYLQLAADRGDGLVVDLGDLGCLPIGTLRPVLQERGGDVALLLGFQVPAMQVGADDVFHRVAVDHDDGGAHLPHERLVQKFLSEELPCEGLRSFEANPQADNFHGIEAIPAVDQDRVVLFVDLDRDRAGKPIRLDVVTERDEVALGKQREQFGSGVDGD
jgi:hypothetical protein